MNKKLINNYLYINKKIFLIISIIIITLGFKSHANENKILFKINDKIITSIDILNEINYLILLNKDFKKFDNKQIYEISKNSLIREKVKEVELNKYYKKLLVDDIYIEPLVKKNFKKFEITSLKSFENLLSQYDLNINEIKKKISIELMWNRLIYQKFKKNVKIDEDLLKKQIKNKKRLNEFFLSEILFTVDKSTNISKRYNLIKEVIKNESFSKAALRFSISESAKNSGKLGWIKETSISEKINKHIKNMKVGEITKPIQIPGGFLILNLEDKREIFKEVNLENELKLIKIKRTNEQLSQYSNIYFQKIKKNIKINEL